MRNSLTLPWIGLLLASATVICAEKQTQAEGRLTLADNGQSEYQIVLSDTLPDPEDSNRLAQTAALVQAAFKANGCAVPVASEGARARAVNRKVNPLIDLFDSRK